MRADSSNEPRGEVTPVADVGRKRRADFAGGERQQSVTRAAGERVLECAPEGGSRFGGIVRGREEQVAAWGERERGHQDGGVGN